MRHVQQNIFLDKDEGGKCSMFRQAEGFVKKQKTKKPQAFLLSVQMLLADFTSF